MGDAVPDGLLPGTLLPPETRRPGDNRTDTACVDAIMRANNCMSKSVCTSGTFVPGAENAGGWMAQNAARYA